MALSLLTASSHLLSYVSDFRSTAASLGALRSLRLAMTSGCARFCQCLADILPAPHRSKGLRYIYIAIYSYRRLGYRSAIG